MIEKLVIEIVMSLKGVDLSPEHKHFIDTNYMQIMVIISDMIRRSSYEENKSE